MANWANWANKDILSLFLFGLWVAWCTVLTYYTFKSFLRQIFKTAQQIALVIWCDGNRKTENNAYFVANTHVVCNKDLSGL